MNVKSISKTKIAFFIMLFHLVYFAVFAAFMAIATLLEGPCNRDGIYVVFAIVSVILLCAFPFVATLINAASTGFQVWALCKKESKLKNIVMMLLTVLYEIAIVVFFISFWQGAMGV